MFMDIMLNKDGTTILNDIFSRYITSNTFIVATVNHETILEYTNNIPNCYYITAEDINCPNEDMTKIINSRNKLKDVMKKYKNRNLL